MNIELTDATAHLIQGVDSVVIRVSNARDVAEVMDIAKDYVASWTPDELASLPEDLRPRPLRAPDQISEYAYHLVRAELIFPDWGCAARKMTKVFVAASRRLSQLLTYHH